MDARIKSGHDELLCNGVFKGEGKENSAPIAMSRIPRHK
jgi:hypothetical protein